MDMRQAAKSALAVQDACNLSGVVFEFARVMQAVCDESHKTGGGTAWRNQHPIVTLFIDKLADLNGQQSEVLRAFSAVEILAAGEDISCAAEDLRAEIGWRF